MIELANDSNGLICAYILDGKGGGRKIGFAEIEQLGNEDGLLWIHLDYSQAIASEWIRNKSGLERNVIEALLAEDSRPRSIELGNGILIVLRGINTNPGSNVEDMVSIRIWLEERRIISSRRRRLLSVPDLEREIENGIGPTDSGSFLAHLSERLVGRIEDVIEEIEEDIEKTEVQIQQGELWALRGHFSGLRRRTAQLRRFLSPQREALNRVAQMAGHILTDQACITLHEQANIVTNFVEELDLARERAMVAQEEILNVLAHQQNSKIYLLSIVSAIFLPLSFLTGLFGMNVAGLPGTESVSAFRMLVIFMILLAAGILLLFRLKKWL